MKRDTRYLVPTHYETIRRLESLSPDAPVCTDGRDVLSAIWEDLEPQGVTLRWVDKFRDWADGDLPWGEELFARWATLTARQCLEALEHG